MLILLLLLAVALHMGALFGPADPGLSRTLRWASVALAVLALLWAARDYRRSALKPIDGRRGADPPPRG